MPTAPPLLFLIALSALAIPGLASAETVWINCHFGGSACPELDSGQLDALITTWESQGATVVVSNTVDFAVGDGSTAILVILRPEDEFDVPIRSVIIPGLLASGGRVVVLGDDEAQHAASNSLLRTWLATVPGHDLVLDEATLALGCEGASSDLFGDPLTDGLSLWRYSAVTSVSGGDTLIQLDANDGGAPLAVVARIPTGGEISLFGDAAGFLTECGAPDFPSSNSTLWRNLYGDDSTALDSDGDGFDSSEDCNDNDPFVYPGAGEECNGVDDDCDGDTDEGCGDDDDTAPGDDDDSVPDDDDDDDTAPDDDDFSDEDDGGAGQGAADWGPSCSCESAPIEGSSSLGLALLGGLALLRKRRR